MKYDIFISYRRDGGYDTAKHLYDLLTRDGYKVSFDIDTLRSGDFDRQLLTRIDECKDFILIVDQHAFDRTLNPYFNPNHDWLRCEVAYALLKKKNIIPIFLSGVNGFPSGLPRDIVEVTKKNGPEYNKYHFNAFYEDLKKRFIKSKSTKRFLKYIAIILFFGGLAALINLLSNPQKTTKTNNENNSDIIERSVDIEFYGNDEGETTIHQELYAKVDGYEYKIELPKDICLKIEAQEDFDGDGIKDALITNIQACGGNAVGNSFFFVSYSGSGYFSISKSFGNNVWEDPEIEEWKGQKSVVIIDTNEGFNTYEDYSSKERYILKQGDAVRVESTKKNSIVALQEIRSSDFHNGKENETLRMSYDLDEDGDDEIFECKYYDRWDHLSFSIIHKGNIIEFKGLHFSRVGILPSITNGFHDLICNEDDVIKWNGKEYDI